MRRILIILLVAMVLAPDPRGIPSGPTVQSCECEPVACHCSGHDHGAAHGPMCAFANGGLAFARLPQHLTVDISAGLDLWKSEPRRLALEFDAQNLSNSVYRISKESETTPLQFAPRRTVLGRLAFHF